MTIRRGRLLALFLALSLVMSLIPLWDGGHDAARAEEYGVVINGRVRLRENASKNSSYWFFLQPGRVCEILSETNAGGVHWYRVKSSHADVATRTSTRTYWGYIDADHFRPLTSDETASYLANNSSSLSGALPLPTGSGSAVVGAVGRVNAGGTNFREGPSKKDHSMMQLDKGTLVTLTSIPAGRGEDYWYGVSYDGRNGYIQSPFIDVVEGGSTPTPTPTSTSGVTPTPTPTGAANSVILIKSSCHMRVSPNGAFDRDNDWVGYGSILPLDGDPVVKDGYTWYPVARYGKTWYVRSDCVQLSGSTPTPTGGVTPTPTPVIQKGTVTTIKSGCNLRSTMGGTVILQIPKGKTMPYTAGPSPYNGYNWYYVQYGDNRGYLRSDVISVDPGGESVTVNPSTSPDPTAQGYVKTNATDVNLRTKAGYTKVIGRVAKGTVMPYFGTTMVNGVTWYRVLHSTLGYGYLHGSFVNIVNSDGSPTPTPAPTAAPTGAIITGEGGGLPEATYSTLRLGTKGSDVTRLTTALRNKGYSITVTNTYTTAVYNVVKQFQRNNKLSVDGIAGPATQHKLYGTVPVGTNTGSLTMTLYPAEKIDWWTGGINEMWKKGTDYKVYDVKTGIVWMAHRWSGGYHADIEPATAADTARICKIYGVTTAAEIKAKNLYQRRPCLITIGNRTFACSLYGVPHNDEGDTIKDNNMTGQICMHFTNSWTHGSKKVDSLHTEAIQYAWEHAPNGHK